MSGIAGDPLHNPHPFARCPFCGKTKAVVLWRVCSKWCKDYSAVTPREQWALPDAPEGTEDPEVNY